MMYNTYLKYKLFFLCCYVFSLLENNKTNKKKRKEQEIFLDLIVVQHTKISIEFQFEETKQQN